jgi:hypothetical protein
VFFAKKLKDHIMGYMNMEKMPKGAKSSDSTGEKKVGASMVDKEVMRPGMSGEKIPKGALSSDTSGERKRPIQGGVGMGMMDGIGSRDSSHMGRIDGRCGEMNTGSKEHVAYEHKRIDHVQDRM